MRSRQASRGKRTECGEKREEERIRGEIFKKEGKRQRGGQERVQQWGESAVGGKREEVEGRRGRVAVWRRQ